MYINWLVYHWNKSFSTPLCHWMVYLGKYYLIYHFIGIHLGINFQKDISAYSFPWNWPSYLLPWSYLLSKKDLCPFGYLSDIHLIFIRTHMSIRTFIRYLIGPMCPLGYLSDNYLLYISSSMSFRIFIRSPYGPIYLFG